MATVFRATCEKTDGREIGLKREIIELLRLRTAELSVGGSTVRGTGRKGVAKAIRDALKEVPLRRFSNLSSSAAFGRVLDRETERVRVTLPRGAQQWGLARKVLNIYLRSAVFSRHLCAEFRLSRMEAWLELPLDSFVGKGICSTPEGANLPRWKTIKGLTPEVNAQYQQCGRTVARRLGVMPAHLEYEWFQREKKSERIVTRSRL